jgi:hypothetical protein
VAIAVEGLTNEFSTSVLTFMSEDM